MGMPQLVVTAVLVEGRTKSEVARDYGVSRRWVITLVQRYLAEGEAGLEPRSRRPQRSPADRRRGRGRDRRDPQGARPSGPRRRRRTRSPSTCSAATGPRRRSPSTIWRILTRRGFVTPQPHKRPKSSLRPLRGRAAQRTLAGRHHPLGLADGTDVEILNIIDDHSRLCLASDARPVFKAARRRRQLPQSRRPPTGIPPACSPTTAPCSPAATAATAGSRSSSSSHARGIASATPGPTTPRPAARSNASTRP